MKALRWLPVIVWFIAISTASFSSLEGVDIPVFPGIDKLAHFGMYLILILLVAIPLKGNLPIFILFTIGTLLFSASTELIQHYFIEGRFGDLLDFLANLIGIGVGCLLVKNRIKT